MTTFRTAEEVLERQLRDDPEFCEQWEKTTLARAVALRLVGYRIEHTLTQTSLARQLGMRQAAISRLEAGDRNPSVDTLLHLSRTLGMEFLVHVTPGQGQARWSDPPADADTVREHVQSERGTVLVLAS